MTAYLLIKYIAFAAYGYFLGAYYHASFPDGNWTMLVILVAFAFFSSMGMAPWYDVYAGKLGFGPLADHDDEKY